MKTIQTLLLGGLLGLGLAMTPSCSSGTPVCDTTTCDGCCSAEGVCLSGVFNDSCGKGGEACQSCSGDLVCSAGACKEAPPEEDAGTDPMDAGQQPQPLPDHATFAPLLEGAFCDYAVRCGVFVSASACADQDYLASAAHVNLAAEAAAIKDARATFNGGSARTCLEDLADRSCETFSTVLTSGACADAVQGSVGDGQMCFNSLECVATHFCDRVNTCPGTCVQKKGMGEMANESAECQDGLAIDGETGTCLAPVAVGNTCSSGGFGPSKTCVEGAYCSETTGLCAAKGDAGDSCMTELECLSPLACRAGKCATLGVVGEACTYSPVEPCRLDLQCDAPAFDQAGTCQVKKSAGASCIEQVQCEAGLFCTGMSMPQTCTAPKALGAACEPFMIGECADDAYCDSTTMECTARKAIGEACTDQDSCPLGSYCDVTCRAFECVDPTP